MSQSVEDWLTQMNGTVEALVLAFGAVVATHQSPEKVMMALEGIIKATEQVPQGQADTPAARAYKAGTVAAVSRLSASANLAMQVKAMNESGTRQ